MEILLEIALAILQFIGELLIQIVFEAIAEISARPFRSRIGRPKSNPLFAALGYILLGVISGLVSLAVFPESFIGPEWLKVLNLFGTPLLAGLMMSYLGAWRRRKGQDLIRLDQFGYGFLFALAMATVRFLWTK